MFSMKLEKTTNIYTGDTMLLYLFVYTTSWIGNHLAGRFVSRKILTLVDLLSIPQSGGKMSKRLGDIIGCKYKTSSWHLNGFPDDSNIGSTV